MSDDRDPVLLAQPETAKAEAPAIFLSGQEFGEEWRKDGDAYLPGQSNGLTRVFLSSEVTLSPDDVCACSALPGLHLRKLHAYTCPECSDTGYQTQGDMGWPCRHCPAGKRKSPAALGSRCPSRSRR